MTDTQCGGGEDTSKKAQLPKQDDSSKKEPVKKEDPFAEVEKAEREYLGQKPGEDPLWTGIGLSGGGIRSATFGLGAVQALARAGLLPHVDYISSVSGGGYIATALQWFWGPGGLTKRPDGSEACRFGVGPLNFPYGTDAPGALPKDADQDPSADDDESKNLRDQSNNLAFLRNHGNYLTPGDGINLFSVAGVVLRTVTVSLLIWMPLLILLFMIVHALDALVLEPRLKEHLISPFGDFLPVKWSACTQDSELCPLKLRAFYILLLYAFGAAAALFVVVSIVFGILSRSAQDTSTPSDRTKGIVFGILMCGVGVSIWLGSRYELGFDAYVLIAVCLLVVAAAGTWLFSLMPQSFAINGSYWLRRWLEVIMGRSAVWVIAILVFGLLPVAPYYIAQKALTASGIAAVITLASGTLSGLYGYYAFVKNISPGLAGRIFAPLGAAIYLFGTISLAYVAAVILINPAPYISNDATKLVVTLLTIVLMVVAVCLGFIASINHVSIHRFYRDRLMEAFMPSEKAIRSGRADYSPVADAYGMTDVLKRYENSDPEKLPGRPYPIINTNVILVDDDNRKVAARGGDNFILSPKFVGSTATGWLDTKAYIDRHGPLSLASAMAVSGAAANANAGYVGTGLTRDRLVSSAMSLLNMGLGLWVGNPGQKEYVLNRVPTYFRPGLTSGVFGFGYKSSSPFLQLSDGGHFENLGLYELVRRKLDTIIIIDGEADSKISLAGLVSATNRIREDFKCVITFDPAQGPERFVTHDSKGYPSGVRYANAPFLVADLAYSNGKHGTLVYIKATMIKDLRFTTSGYWAAHPDFPHQTTADQFFDPDQFEAYRDLGFKSAELMINALDLKTTITQKCGIMKKYKEIVAALNAAALEEAAKAAERTAGTLTPAPEAPAIHGVATCTGEKS